MWKKLKNMQKNNLKLLRLESSEQRYIKRIEKTKCNHNFNNNMPYCENLMREYDFTINQTIMMPSVYNK